MYPLHFGRLRSAGDDFRACCTPDTHERGHSATHPSTLPQPTHQVKPAPEMDLATGLRESFFWRELVYLLINFWTLLRAAGVVRTPNSCIFDHICHPAFLCFPLSAHRKDIKRSLGVCQASSAHALRGGAWPSWSCCTGLRVHW